MKKILLSCVTCLLALGLVTACNNEEEETPEEPEVPGTVVDEGETTYLFGFEVGGTLTYIDGGTVSGYSYEGTVTTDVSKAAAISYEVSGSTYYLSFDNGGATKWITIVDNGEHVNLNYVDSKAPLYLHTTEAGAEYFGDESGEHFVCYNSTYKCAYSSLVSQYIESSPVAGLYTTDGKLIAGGIGEEPAPDPEPVGEMKEVETGYLGLLQLGLNDYCYFTGEINESNFGVLSSDFDDAAMVTVWQDDAYYYLTVGSEDNNDLKYIACDDTSKSAMSLHEEPYCLLYNEEYDAWLTGNGKEFLATYGTYTTLSWANVNSYLGKEGEYIAHIYGEKQELGAPESFTISGYPSVYVGKTTTLTADIPAGYVQTVTWSIDLPSDGEGEEVSAYASIDENTGVVTGIAEYTGLVVKAVSTADDEVSAEFTIDVVDFTAPDTTDETIATYKLGALDSANFTYRYFSGSISANHLSTTTEFSSAANVYITAQEDGIENSCTLSILDSNTLKYLCWTDSTNMALQETAQLWIWDEENELFYTPESGTGTSARFLALYVSGNSADIRPYALSNVDSYAHIVPYTEAQTNPERPAVESVLITGNRSEITVGKKTQLTATALPEEALSGITWSSSDSTKATVDQSGIVTGVAVTSEGSPVIITATSDVDTSISDTYEITVVESVATGTSTADFTSLSANGYEQQSGNNTYTILTGTTNTSSFTCCSIVWDDGSGNSSNNTRVNTNYIQLYGGEKITFAPTAGYELVEIAITCTSGYVQTVTSSEASSEVVGNDIVVYGIIDGTKSVTITNAASSQARISSITIDYISSTEGTY